MQKRAPGAQKPAQQQVAWRARNFWRRRRRRVVTEAFATRQATRLRSRSELFAKGANVESERRTSASVKQITISQWLN